MAPDRRALALRVAPWLAIVLAVGLLTPLLRQGYTGDEIGQVTLLERNPHVSDLPRVVGAFFDFSPDAGYPDRTGTWWATGGGQVRFFRPLAVLTHALDHAIAPRRAWVAHAHDLLWFALLAVLAARAFQRLVPAAWAAGLATFAFAVNDVHTDVRMISVRNGVMACAFSVAALLAFVRWREHRRTRDLALALAAHVAAMLSAEMGVVVVALVGARALTFEAGPLWRRVRPALPFLGVVVAIAAVHALLGYGTRDVGHYTHPLHDPAAFFAAIVRRVPVVLGLEVAQLDPEHGYLLETLAPSDVRLLVGGALVGLALVAWAWSSRLRTDPALRFWVLATVAVAIPLCAGGLTHRQSVMIAFTAIGAVATVASSLDREALRQPLGALLALHAAWVLVGHPITMLPVLPRLAIDGSLEEIYANTFGDAPAGTKVVFVVVPSGAVMHMARTWVDFAHQAAPEAAITLASGGCEVDLTRPSANVLEARATTPVPLVRLIDLDHVRSQRTRLRVGQVIDRGWVRATVLAATDRGEPLHVRYEFRDLADPTVRVRGWDSETQAMGDVELPAVGESMLVPAAL